MIIRFITTTTLLFSLSAQGSFADDLPNAVEIEPPNFGVAIDLMVAERQKLESYYCNFTTVLEKNFENDTNTTSLIEGAIAVDSSRGISVFIQRNLDAINTGTESEFLDEVLEKQVRNDIVAIDTAELQATGSSESDVLAFTTLKRPAFRKPFVPFDIRTGAFGFVSDFVSGRTLEETVIGLAEKFGNRPGKWSSPGVAEYLLPGHLIQIDLERGCWPISYQQIRFENVDGQYVKTIPSSGSLTIIKEGNSFVPERLTMESKSIRVEYLFEFVEVGKGYPLEEWTPETILTEFGGGRTPKEVPFGVNLKKSLIR